MGWLAVAWSILCVVLNFAWLRARDRATWAERSRDEWRDLYCQAKCAQVKPAVMRKYWTRESIKLLKLKRKP